MMLESPVRLLPGLTKSLPSPAYTQAENRFENFGGTVCRAGHLQAGGVPETKTE